MLVYVSGKYSIGDVKSNIAVARGVAIQLWEKGFAVICPHLNTQNFEKDCAATYDDYINGDLEIVARCDAIVMLPWWEESKGANIEKHYAEGLGIPIYIYPEIPERHMTEQRCPRQARAFIETVMGMYRLHLSKNADYSSANILATGEIGLITRLWDKIARLLSLQGFRFSVQFEGLELPKVPKHETIEDTLNDAAVYSIIGLLFRKNIWGK